MEPILDFSEWNCVIHYNKSGIPIWFSYCIWGYINSVGERMIKDLSIHFNKQIVVYDIFGMEGCGTARIRIISD